VLPLRGEPGLDGIEQVSVQQGRLGAGTDLSLEQYLSDIERVAQHLEQGALPERDAASGRTRRQPAQLGPEATFFQFRNQPVDAANLPIAPEDGPDLFGLLFGNEELVVPEFVAQTRSLVEFIERDYLGY